MRKLSVRWVPCLLTVDQKPDRRNISNALLVQFGRNKSDFWRRFITVDETWIHQCTPETKIQSKQWTAKEEPAPKKANTVFSVDKVMATVFGTVFGNRLSSNRKNHYRSIPRVITWQSEGRTCGKTATFGEKNSCFAKTTHFLKKFVVFLLVRKLFRPPSYEWKRRWLLPNWGWKREPISQLPFALNPRNSPCTDDGLTRRKF